MIFKLQLIYKIMNFYRQSNVVKSQSSPINDEKGERILKNSLVFGEYSIEDDFFNCMEQVNIIDNLVHLNIILYDFKHDSHSHITNNRAW